MQKHNSAVFTTLTYDNEHLPPTLQKRDLSLWLKRLRAALAPTERYKRKHHYAKQAARPIRFFASGEYGEQTQRPHYHAIVFGGRREDAPLIEKTWGLGHTRTDQVTPARIAYVAGYTSKKIGWKQDSGVYRDDRGRKQYREAPFIQMSRRPGIGANAKRFIESWRQFAVHNGHIMPVPRYLHEAWKQQATEEDLEQLAYEKEQYRQGKQPLGPEHLAAAEQIARTSQAIQAARRTKV